MPILELLQDAWSVYKKRNGGADAAWAQSEEAFEENFELPFGHFVASLEELDRAQYELYEKTIVVNPEAAICWVLFITG